MVLLYRQYKKGCNNDGITTIGNYSFWNCPSLSSVTIPEDVMTIGDCAFSDCTSLSSVTISEGVTEIGNYIFDDCSSDVEISGYTGSVAGIYAKKNNIKFKSLGQMPYLPPLETNVVILDSFKDKVNVTKFEDNGSVKFEAELLGGYDDDLTLYVAIYDSDGSLKGIEKASANQEEDKLIWNISKPDSKDLYKIMMWNNKNQPIIKAMK